MFLDQIAFSWFIQNQIKRHAPSARAPAYSKICLVRVQSFKSLFNISYRVRRDLHQFHFQSHLLRYSCHFQYHWEVFLSTPWGYCSIQLNIVQVYFVGFPISCSISISKLVSLVFRQIIRLDPNHRFHLWPQGVIHLTSCFCPYLIFPLTLLKCYR